MRKSHAILEIFRETRVLRQRNVVWLIAIKRIRLADKLAPLLEPLRLHVGSAHQEEALAKVAHRVTKALAQSRVVLVVPRQHLVRSFLLGRIKNFGHHSSKGSEGIDEAYVHAAASRVKVHVKWRLTRVNVEQEAGRLVFQVVQLSLETLLGILNAS